MLLPLALLAPIADAAPSAPVAFAAVDAPSVAETMPESLRAAVATVTDDREVRLSNGGHLETGHYETGYSVSISGRWAVVGMPGAGTGGEVLAFQRTGADWKLRRTLFNGFSVGAGDRFGETVALTGNYLLIGVPGSNTNGVDSGRVESWKLVSGQWNRLEWDIQPPGSTAGARFGSAIGLDGSIAVIGSPDSGNGVVDMYVRNDTTWVWKTRVAPNDVTAGARFGASIDVDGTYAVIGAPDNNGGAGAAFAYLRSAAALNRQAELTPTGPQPSSHFGADVALDGSWAAVTQPGWVDGNGRVGRVLSFQRASATWPQKTAVTSAPSVAFATAVDVSGTTAVVGQDGDRVVPFTRGSGGVWTRGAAVSVAPDDIDLPSSALALAGDYAVYGSPTSPGIFGEANIGATGMLFRAGNGTWSVQDRIQMPSAQSGEKFGYSVAYDNTGTYALVGAPGSNGGAGAAYLFRSNGDIMWLLQARFEADVPTPGAGFGTSVAINGAYFVVGAPNEGTGAAYVFFRAGTGTEWTRQARLTPDVGGGGVEDFGHSVAINGAYVAVGSPGDLSTTGQSFVYHRGGVTWTQQARMAPPGAVPSDKYGYSVALAGTVLVVGAPGASGAGAAYVWIRSTATWRLKNTLTPNGGLSGDDFGTSVDISGNRVVVGAPDNGDYSAGAGAAYVFTRASSGPWPQERLLPGSAGIDGDFGWDVAIDQERVLVGDPVGPNPRNTLGGRAVHFRLSGTTWFRDQVLTQNLINDVDNDSQCGLSVDLSHTATSNAGGNDFGIVGCPQLTTSMGEAGKTFIYYP